MRQSRAEVWHTEVPLPLLYILSVAKGFLAELASNLGGIVGLSALVARDNVTTFGLSHVAETLALNPTTIVIDGGRWIESIPRGVMDNGH